MHKPMILCALVSAIAWAADPSVASRLVGSWKLVSFERTTTDGKLSYPRGAEPIGRITYDAGGRMGVHIMRPGRAKFTGSDSLQAADAEAAAAYRGYTAYFGAYVVDQERGVVIHKVEGSLYPNYIGTDQVRKYTLSGNRLTLEAVSPGGRSKLVWEKLP